MLAGARDERVVGDPVDRRTNGQATARAVKVLIHATVGEVSQAAHTLKGRS